MRTSSASGLANELRKLPTTRRKHEDETFLPPDPAFVDACSGNPEGLKFPGKEGDGLTDEQRPILQKLAWDMVSKYPYAGIAKFEAPQPKKEAEKTLPKSGAGATAVPEALKGWKATNDLPADTVVTDYNDYIEKFPKAERPGVSDVKYYVDDTGRNAVAVLVVAEGTQWTHLLVYDRTNRRTSMTKFVSGK